MNKEIHLSALINTVALAESDAWMGSVGLREVRSTEGRVVGARLQLKNF